MSATGLSSRSAQNSSILYQNEDSSITLIDIPRSIALAQNRSDILLSTSPLETPIELEEKYQPNLHQAKAHIAQDISRGAQHAAYRLAIQHALAEIETHISRPWCMPRKLMSPNPEHGNDLEIGDAEKELDSRLREWATWAESKGDDAAFDLQRMMVSLGATAEPDVTATNAVARRWSVSYEHARGTTNGAHAEETVSRKQHTEPWRSTLHNTEGCPLRLTVAENSSQNAEPQQEYRFTIPPRSTFYLCDSTHSDSFRTAFRQITGDYSLPRHFDLVLLDPPWPNRSAKRKGAYEQVGGMPYLKRMLLSMDIDTYLEHNALVGVWITNKEVLREHVLGPGGLFEAWNVGLVEEWIWIKTTTKGEPMFDIDSTMRKPYEILLLGRAAPNSWTTVAHAPVVKKRVIAAVPDIHSRKPCLKELLAPFMPDPDDYAALEVFSRYLVSGWTSRGNEVLKYNSDLYWASEQHVDAAHQHHLPIRTA